MKTILASTVAACTILTGCVAVPVADPGVHISGTVRSGPVHRPYYGHGHHGGRHHGPSPRQYRDRDGDGVPNGYDRRPRNPYRY